MEDKGGIRMRKFSNKEEQAEWFLIAYKREDIKIADKISVLVNHDCGDFKNFLCNNLRLLYYWH